MQLRTPVEAMDYPFRLEHNQAVFCMGSCFSEVLAQRLMYHKFPTMTNPFGVLFHPTAISTAVQRIYTAAMYTEQEIFRRNELYFSWDHNSNLSLPNKERYLERINGQLQLALQHLAKTQLVSITLGTAWVYELLELGITVANCHKVPNTKFGKRLLDLQEIQEQLRLTCQMLQEINPKVQILLTLSPVRHTKEGLVQNNRSKARLLEGIHGCIAQLENVHYFPSYEMLMDDLRDYRFMEEDLIHPNNLAKSYVWERFEQEVVSEKARAINREIHKIQQQLQHKILHPTTLQAKQFIYNCIKQIRAFHDQHKRKDFEPELEILLQKLNA